MGAIIKHGTKTTDHHCHDRLMKSARDYQNLFNDALADDAGRSVSPLASVEVGFTSTVGVGGSVVVLSPFFFLPNETPKLLAKLANVPLAVAVLPFEGPAKGEGRGI
jgi:hypothetical protein